MTSKELKDMPGPWGVPVFGSLLSLTKFKERTLTQWADEYYGPIFQVRLGATRVVMLNGYEAVQEAFCRRTKSFAGRLEAPVFTLHRGLCGLSFTQHDEVWRGRRDGVDRGIESLCESIRIAVADESEHLKNALDRQTDKEANISDHLRNAVINAVMQTCFSRRFERNDPELNEIMHLAYKDIKDEKFVALTIMPWLSNIPSFKRFLDQVPTNTKKFGEKMRKLCDEARDENVPNLTSFILQARKCASEEHQDELAFVLGDLIQAGLSSFHGFLNWLLLFLLKHPECSKRAQEELDAVLRGCDNPVYSALSEKRQHLNYCLAILEECFRLRPMAPVGLVNQTSEEVEILGYRLPKGTPVMQNIWSVHHEKQYWGPDTEDFRPDRHLDPEGIFKKSGHVFPFGLGLRACPGKRIVEVGLFAYMVTILYYFDAGLASNDADVDMKGVSSTLLYPPKYAVELTKRKTR